MKIDVTLTNVKYFAAMSRETDCFTATVRINGKVACEVENHGSGGPDMFSDRRVETLLNNYAKGLPKVRCGTYELEQTAEIIVGDLLQRHLQRKKLLDTMRTKLVFTDASKPGQIFTSKKHPVDVIDQWCASWRANPAAGQAKLKADVLLNVLPEEEAMTIWMAFHTAN